jgi:hypothetical protein
MNKEYIYFIKAKVKAMAFPLHIARACPVDKANPAWFSDLRKSPTSNSKTSKQSRDDATHQDKDPLFKRIHW